MAKVRPKDIAQRIKITGISTPFGGVQWEPHHLEIEHQATDSLLKIREMATDTLGKLPEESKAVGPIRAIRAACRRFLDEPHPDFHHLQIRPSRRYPGEANSGFFVALGELRATVGMQVATLAVTYDLSIDEELATILPAEDAG